MDESVLDGKTRRERTSLCILLCLAFLHGMLHVFVVPPWQHYDEPTHFEYVRLIVDHMRLPEIGDHDPALSREIAASMIEHRFYRDLGYPPSLLSDGPVGIGASELGHPPAYYLLLSLPLYWLRYSDVAVQLFVCRLVSLSLYLLSILLSYKTVAEIVAPGHPLRLAVPGLMVFLAPYTDLMTAVNNDVGATVVMSLFLWGAVRTVIRGTSALNLLWVTATAALCVFTKKTASVAVVLLPPVLALAWIPRRRMWWAVGLVCAAGMMAAVAMFSWGDALSWYRLTYQDAPTAPPSSDAPWGRRALAVEVKRNAKVYQILPADTVRNLRGKTVALGAWMWADRPLKARMPLLNDGKGTWRTVELDETPSFYVITKTVSVSTKWVQVVLYPYLGKDSPAGVTVYYDGLVMVEMEHPPDTSPLLEGGDGRVVVWGGRRFTNLVRNASAESVGPRLRPWFERRLVRYTRRRPSLVLDSLFDWQAAKRVHRATATNLFNSFWCRFGWNSVGLSVGWMYVATTLSAIGLLGALVGVFKNAGGTRGRALIVLGFAAALAWLNAQLRSLPPSPNPFIPSARYTYPAIIPTALALVGGWWSLAPRRARRWTLTIAFAILGLLDVAALSTIWTFWYGR